MVRGVYVNIRADLRRLLQAFGTMFISACEGEGCGMTRKKDERGPSWPAVLRCL